MPQWVRFATQDGRIRRGALQGDGIAEHAGGLFDPPSATGEAWRTADVALLPPCEPGKIVALWNNFHALAAKLDKAPPRHPLFLIKPATSVAGSGQPIERPRSYAGKIVFEGELGIVVGARCRDVSVEEARRAIFGYTCVNDVTAAEILGENPDFAQWTRAKGFDTFGCLGPAIATRFDWAGARVITRVDGVERQNYPLADMIVLPPEIVSRVSQDMTLLPGDVIACGTSLGVGSIRDGSTVEIFIDGIGTLTNTLAAR